MILPLLARPFKNPCAGAPSITGHTVSQITAPTCTPVQGWVTRSSVTTGTLGSFKIERQYALDSAGTSWTAWVINQNATQDYTHAPTFGTDGAGVNETKYFKARARIVAADNTPCSGWTESSSQLSRTEAGCQT